MSQFRVHAELEMFDREHGGVLGSYPSPVTSFLVEPADPDILERGGFDRFGAVVIDLDDGEELSADRGPVGAVLTFLDGAEAREHLGPGLRFSLSLGLRRIGAGTVGSTIEGARTPP